MVSTTWDIVGCHTRSACGWLWVHSRRVQFGHLVAHLGPRDIIPTKSSAFGLYGEKLGPDRISGSRLLSCATERKSGRALSQWYGKMLRFPIVRSVPRFQVSLPAGWPARGLGLGLWSSELRRQFLNVSLVSQSTWVSPQTDVGRVRDWHPESNCASDLVQLESHWLFPHPSGKLWPIFCGAGPRTASRQHLSVCMQLRLALRVSCLSATSSFLLHATSTSSLWSATSPVPCFLTDRWQAARTGASCCQWSLYAPCSLILHFVTVAQVLGLPLVFSGVAASFWPGVAASQCVCSCGADNKSCIVRDRWRGKPGVLLNCFDFEYWREPHQTRWECLLSSPDTGSEAVIGAGPKRPTSTLLVRSH